MSSTEVKISKLEQAMKIHQKACRAFPCAGVQRGVPKCPFCPHWKEVLKRGG